MPTSAGGAILILSVQALGADIVCLQEVPASAVAHTREEGKEDLLPLWLLKPRPPATVCEPCGDTEMPDADANTPPPALPLTAEREQAAPSASSSNDAVYTSAAIPGATYSRTSRCTSH